MTSEEDMVKKAKEYREDFPDDWFQFLKESDGYYKEYEPVEVRLCDFYRWVCSNDVHPTRSKLR